MDMCVEKTPCRSVIICPRLFLNFIETISKKWAFIPRSRDVLKSRKIQH